MKNWCKAAVAVLGLITAVDSRGADNSLVAIPPNAQPPAVRFELVGKVEERPVLVTHDHTGRTFVVEQPGRIWRIRDGKIVEDKPFLDIADQVYAEGECGLLGLTFHPKFAENGLFYINCVVKSGGKRMVNYAGKMVEQNTIQTVIGEYKVDPKADSVADARSIRRVLVIDQPYENHNGGMVAFGPDGMLYIGMGDGGNQRDPSHNGQNVGVLLAKMLRIDVDHRDEGKGYAIPKDNPFIGKQGARPEIFAYGLRNPWRFSFDRQTGLLYAGDVGEDRWEEVDIVKSGGNYGWSEREGFYRFNRSPMQRGEKKQTGMPDDHPGFADPIKVYWHDIGMSITGGYVYRGKAIPALQGWYLYGDYSKGTIWGLRYDGQRLVGDATIKIVNERDVRPMLPSGFGEDGEGEVYVCSHQDGKVWKIVPPGR